MTTQARNMERLGKTLDKESYEWLSTHHAEIAEAVESEVLAGRNPEQIRLFVIKATGRIELAQRCEQAARHVKEMQGNK